MNSVPRYAEDEKKRMEMPDCGRRKESSYLNMVMKTTMTPPVTKMGKSPARSRSFLEGREGPLKPRSQSQLNEDFWSKTVFLKLGFFCPLAVN